MESGDQSSGGSFGEFGTATLIQQHGGDARIAEFPERAVEDEMMEIHKRSEGEKAGDKISVKDTADDPRTGNE